MVYFLPVIPAVDPGPDGSGSLLGILLVVNLFFNAVPCALTALALWRTARWRGILRPWLALIPVADLWVLGKLRDMGRPEGRRMHRILPVLGLCALGSTATVELLSGFARFLNEGAGTAVVIIAFLGALAVWGVFLVVRFAALCEMYQAFAPDKAGWYIALSIVFPPLMALFIFKCKW